MIADVLCRRPISVPLLLVSSIQPTLRVEPDKAEHLVQSGLCTAAQLGGFITSLPEDKHLNDTSIYTTPLKFVSSSFPTTPTAPTEPEGEGDGDGPEDPTLPPQVEEGEKEEDDRESEGEDTPTPPWEFNDRSLDITGRKRQWDLIEGIANGLTGGSQNKDEQGGGDVVYEVPTYIAPIHYNVPKTGYYCVGKLPRSVIRRCP